MKNALKFRLIIFLLLTFSVILAVYYYDENRDIRTMASRAKDGVVNINYNSGFYDHALRVKIHRALEVPPFASVRYTLNGDDPTLSSERYHGQLDLSIPDETSGDVLVVYPLKVAVCYPDGQCSQAVNRTYILGRDLASEFDLDVISLATDQSNLYDYYRGIFVDGWTRDASEANKGAGRGNYHNRNPEWIRDSHLTLFTPTGEIKIDQPVGIMVSGDSSADHEVRSLKIIANKKYGYQPFDFDFYQPGDSAAQHLPLTYNSLRLRAGSQDRVLGNIRSAVINTLISQTEFDGYSATKRAIVYLNGKFYGLVDIQQNFSQSFLAKKFGLANNEKVEKVKGSEERVLNDLGVKEFFQTNLNDPQKRAELEKVVDMDNYLQYYALNVACNNIDWGHKNYEAWRYTGQVDDNNHYTDGRVRFLAFDFDFTYFASEEQLHLNGHESADDTLTILMEKLPAFQESTFPRVMESTYYRDKFLTILQNYLNGPFKQGNVATVINEQKKLIDQQMQRRFNQEKYEEYQTGIDEMRQVVATVPERIATSLAHYWSLADKYTLSLATDEGNTISWPGQTLYQGRFYSNDYYIGTNVTLTAHPAPGYDFDHWLLNGEPMPEASSATLVVTADLVRDGTVAVKAISRPRTEKLFINEAAAEGHRDWIKITNFGQETLPLNEFYLSDTLDNLKLCALPEHDLAPDASFVITGKSSLHVMGDFQCGFNLQSGETIYLQHGDITIDSLLLPAMNNSESYGRYQQTNERRFFYNRHGERQQISDAEINH